METVSRIAELRHALESRRAERIGLVPTMGNLHAGHLRLVEQSVASCDVTVTSIFVNPLQFGATEDLGSYPLTPAEDHQQLNDAGVDLLFSPDPQEIYPNGADGQTVVSVPGLSSRLCGASRPGHFDGVATVVTKLFNIAQPDAAFFGTKDYQQLALIRTMVRHLDVPIEIVGVETVRAEDGLALSSRNAYLNADERVIAPALYATLSKISGYLAGGRRDFAALESEAQHSLEDAGFRCDFVSVCDAQTLEPANREDLALVILGAGYLGATRLIDNVRVDLV